MKIISIIGAFGFTFSAAFAASENNFDDCVFYIILAIGFFISLATQRIVDEIRKHHD